MKLARRGCAWFTLAILLFPGVCLMTASPARAASGTDQPAVALATDARPGPPVRYALAKLTAALRAGGVTVAEAKAVAEGGGGATIVAGLARGAGPAARLHEELKIPAPAVAEALCVRDLKHKGRRVILVSGADDRGLMYALLDLADRVGWPAKGEDPLQYVRDADEKPYVSERALSKYTMHPKHFESTFHDEKYWARYLDMLAKSRFNTFALLFAYESGGYFAPPYPYFQDVEGYESVRVVGLTKQQQANNLASLKRIIRMTHERGMHFTLGIWDHIYRGGVQGPTGHAKKPTPGLVWGVTKDNLVAYTNVALAKFVKTFPEIDAIQFRMHGESGLKRGEMPVFWTNVYKIMKTHAPRMRFDARAKNFPDSLIDKAVEMGVPIRITTKYWMEQMGLPFHPTHVNPRNQHDRRHGYADLLRYPRQYKMHWRLWNGGTTRILLWADPEYVRRFAESTHLYDGEGFEINEPLATKMQDQPHDEEPFELLNPKYRWYDWEFERYWHFFQVWGRVSYNPNTPTDIWEMEFRRRFGEAGPVLWKALHQASRVLPRIVAYNYPYGMFPTTRGWVEKQRMSDLPTYAAALPSDTQQFLSFDAAARNRIDGRESAKIHPLQSAEWFGQRKWVSLLEVLLTSGAGASLDTASGKEWASTMADLKILGGLAQYHAHRARAGLQWALYKHSHDVGALDAAIEHEARAVTAWRGIVRAAGDVYNFDLKFGRRGAGLSGHWKDELAQLEKGLAKLRTLRKQYRPNLPDAGPGVAHVPVRKARPGEGVSIRATVAGKAKLRRVRLACRVGQGDWAYADMKAGAEYLYQVEIPKDKATPGLAYFIEAEDQAGRVATYPAKGEADPIHVIVSEDNDPPEVDHAPVATAPAGKPLTIRAKVADASGVKWVRLRYRSVTQFEDYRLLEMKPTAIPGEYAATVPGEHIPAKYDFMYFIEAHDKAGNGCIWPDLEKRTPYIVVKVAR